MSLCIGVSRRVCLSLTLMSCRVDGAATVQFVPLLVSGVKDPNMHVKLMAERALMHALTIMSDAETLKASHTLCGVMLHRHARSCVTRHWALTLLWFYLVCCRASLQMLLLMSSVVVCVAGVPPSRWC